MINPQYTLTFSLGVGEDGLKRRARYEKAAGNKTLSKWIKDSLDKQAELALPPVPPLTKEDIYGSPPPSAPPRTRF